VEPGNELPLSVQDEVRKLIDLARVMARTLGFNNSELARKADVPLASLVRYFKGEGEPKMEFLLSLLRAMGLGVREFFELAYPESDGMSPARKRIGILLDPVRPGRILDPVPPPKPEPKPEHVLPTREEIEKMMDDLRRDVRDIMEGRAKRQPDPNGES
jgi:transcriptional regulator with XRE-family HTH domain